MSITPSSRPTSCLWALLRQAQHPRPSLHRSLSTTIGSTSSRPFYDPPPPPPPRSKLPDAYTTLISNTRSQGQIKPSLYRARYKGFAVFPRAIPVKSPFQGIVRSFDTLEIAKLDPSGARTALIGRTSESAARVGDILLVTRREGEPFAGVLMQIRQRGVDTAILLRGQLMGTGVEMWFKVYSPQVSGIDIVWRRPKRARRARLTYLRKPKHDIGSVESYVLAWRKEMKVLRGKGRADGTIETRF